MCGTVRERLPGAIKTVKAYNSNINATTTPSATTTTGFFPEHFIEFLTLDI
jgi:hypothetical protein